MYAVLSSQPLANRYVLLEKKKATTYDFWVRPTISWKLVCEATDSRADVLAAIASEQDKEDLKVGWTRTVAIVGYVAGLFTALVLSCFAALGKKGMGKKKCRQIFAGLLGVQAVLFLTTYFMVRGQATELQDRKSTIARLQSMNPCGDKFT